MVKAASVSSVGAGMAQKSISKGKAHESGDCKEYQNEKNATAPKQIEKENASEIYVSIICRMLDAYTDKSHLDVTWIAACYSHIQRTFSSTRGEEDKASQQLINLCGELYDQDAAKLQLKVIKYLEDQTQAECAFILLVVPETQELFCQVIGKKVLETEVRFPGHSSSFAVALETNQPIHLDDIPKENVKGIEEVVECTLQSFLCVPIASRSDNSLIALACLVNKTNANRFTDRDISCVQQCFRYTATVLTSTIAFQNERRLKLHSQALLQVARNLFTNLGELKTSPSEGFDNFPWIRSRMCEVNMHGVTASRTLKRDRYVYFCNCIMVDGGACQEWKYPFRCQLEESGENGKCPNELKDLALKCIKFHIDQTKTVSMHAVDNSYSMKVVGMASEQNHIINTSNDDDDKEEDKGKTSQKDTSKIKSLMKQSSSPKKKTDSSTQKAGSPKPSPELSKTSPDKKTESPPPPKGFFGGWMFYRGKETEESDGENNDRDDTMEDKDVTLVEEDSDHVTQIQLSPQANILLMQLSPQSLKSDSQVSCVSYHTASGADVENELASDYDKEMEAANETYFDSWEFLNSPAGLKGASYSEYLDSISGKAGVEKHDSGGFTPMTVHNTSSHEFYIEDADSGQGHTFNTSLMNVSQSFSLDEILEADSGLGSVTHASSKTDQSNYTAQMHVNDTYESCKDKEMQEQGKATPDKDEDVITTVSAVDMTSLQCPETELLPFTQNDLTNLLREIMQQARNLTHAERCSVFLIDKETDELVAKVFDGIQANDNENEATEIRMPSTQGIAGHVATSGELLNIRDAYSHPLFYRGIDDTTGFKTRNILCFPIKDGKGTILGVAQLCNKKVGPCFTQFDEDVATAFGIYCCISINHSMMYKKVMDSQVRNTLANELMMYHMKCLMYKKLMDSQHRKSLVNEIMIYHMQVSPNDVVSLMTVDIPHPRLMDADFIKFSYAPRLLPEDRTTLSTLSMMEDLGFISRWRIKRETLARFVLMVKKGYRNPPYHNWMHAYTVGQFCYQLIRNLRLEKYFDEIELFALFVSCLCHDIDHRGTTNAFQISSKSVLAALYSSEGSVLERHHFAQTMCILNTEGCNVFENLDSKEYQQILDYMRDNILATDLQHHFDILPALRNIAERGFDKMNLKQRKLLQCLIMTSCDLSDQTKKWENAKGVAAMIYKEFFSEGDMEKARGKRPPSSFDRERVEIPTHQISFIEKVAMPVYKVLADIFPDATELVETVEENQAHWEKISNLIRLKKGGSCAKMTFEEVLAIENEAETPREINHNEFNSENEQQSADC